MEFLSDAWMQALSCELNADKVWVDAAKHVSLRLAIKSGDTVGTLDIRDGQVTSALANAHPLGSDITITITGPDAEWQLVQKQETDWFQGMSPGIGQLGIEGNAVGALRNVKTMWLTLKAVGHVAHKPAAPPAYSPEPKPSGRPTTGHYIMVEGIRTYYEEAGEG
jgi:hypothetical protein